MIDAATIEMKMGLAITGVDIMVSRSELWLVVVVR
jgi:hypothetical protein